MRRNPILRRLLTAATILAMPLGLATVPALTSPAFVGEQRFAKVAYFTQWGIYGRNYFVKNILTSGTAGRLTHINYAFANVGSDGKCFEAAVPGKPAALPSVSRMRSAKPARTPPPIAATIWPGACCCRPEATRRHSASWATFRGGGG